MDAKLLAVAGGQAPADLVVKNGKIVNVYTKEIYDGGVAVANGKIAAVGDVDYAIGEGTKVIDANGNYITPGFIDGHSHLSGVGAAFRKCDLTGAESFDEIIKLDIDAVNRYFTEFTTDSETKR